MTRTKENIHVLYLGEDRYSPRTSQRNQAKPSIPSRASRQSSPITSKGTRAFPARSRSFVSVLIDIQGLRARRSVAKTRAKRSTHPRRTIRVREIAAPARTCNQRFKDPLRRSDRPTNSCPSFPEVEAKPRPAPNIRSRSSPAGCAAASSNPDSINPFAGSDQRRSIKVPCPRFRIRPKTGSIAEDLYVCKSLHRASVVLTSFNPVPIYYRKHQYKR